MLCVCVCYRKLEAFYHSVVMVSVFVDGKHMEKWQRGCDLFVCVFVGHLVCLCVHRWETFSFTAFYSERSSAFLCTRLLCFCACWWSGLRFAGMDKWCVSDKRLCECCRVSSVTIRSNTIRHRTRSVTVLLSLWDCCSATRVPCYRLRVFIFTISVCHQLPSFSPFPPFPSILPSFSASFIS